MSGKEYKKRKSLIDSMLVYWIVLLLFSLGVASLIYVIWLKEGLV